MCYPMGSPNSQFGFTRLVHMAQRQIAKPLAFWIAIGSGFGVSLHSIPMGVALDLSFDVAIGHVSQKKAQKDRDRSA